MLAVSPQHRELPITMKTSLCFPCTTEEMLKIGISSQIHTNVYCRKKNQIIKAIQSKSLTLTFVERPLNIRFIILSSIEPLSKALLAGVWNCDLLDI